MELEAAMADLEVQKEMELGLQAINELLPVEYQSDKYNWHDKISCVLDALSREINNNVEMLSYGGPPDFATEEGIKRLNQRSRNIMRFVHLWLEQAIDIATDLHLIVFKTNVLKFIALSLSFNLAREDTYAEI